MRKERIVKNEKEMQQLAIEVLQGVSRGGIIALHGDLGSGKTTFSQFFLEGLGVKKVKSPTFALYREYEVASQEIRKAYHFDMYRIHSAEDVLGLGFEEMLEEEGVVMLIEWAENISELLPDSTVHVYLEDMGGTSRRVRVQK